MNKMYNTALEILKLLKQNNFEAYIIGGYPRDKYLKKNNDDIDICTSAKYKDIKKLFKETENNKYGSYRIKYKDFEYEITTFRKETKYLNNRYPKKIKYTKSLKKDLKRRDFIINTLCINEYGSYIDILNAKKDIDNKIIRLVGPKTKIKQDSLRILRAIRFATILDFQIDKKLDKAINKYKMYLENLSFDRKKQELEKILNSENIKYGIQLIKKYKLENYLKINTNNLIVTNNINGIWAQILTDNSYSFNKNQQKEIEIIKKLKEKEFDEYDLYKYGPNIFEIVNEIKKENIDVKKTYEKLPIKDRDEIKTNFFDICKIIEVNNTTIGIIYEDIEKQIIYRNIKNTKKDIVKYIKENYEYHK